MRENDKPPKKPVIYQMFTKNGLLYAIVMLLTACTNSLGASSFCDIYEPVYFDLENDTKETIEQIDRNNIVYARFCKNRSQ